MATVHGTSHNDLIHVAGDGHTPAAGQTDVPDATNGDDVIITGDGNDTIYAGGGDDEINFKSFLNNNDKIDGGAGNDTVVVKSQANFSGTALSMVNVETVAFYGTGGGFTLAAGDVTTGQSLLIDARHVASNAQVDIQATNETGDITYDTVAMNALLLNSGSGNDTFNINGVSSQSDNVLGGGGNDVFNVHADLGTTGFLEITGGTGNDTLNISGGARGNTLEVGGVEQINLRHGADYTFVPSTTFDPTGQTVTIDGSNLQAGDILTVSTDTDIKGTLTVIGGRGDDVFDASRGGSFSINGGAGDDTTTYGSLLTATSHVDGGTGNDIVLINGDYDLALAGTDFTNVVTLSLGAGHNYSFTADDGVVGKGHTMTVDGTALGAANTLVFDGSAETDGYLRLLGGAGNDVLTGGSTNDTFAGGQGDDVINLQQGGNDTAEGNAGNDVFNVGAALGASDRIDGGSGNDTINIDGDYSDRTVLNGATFSNVENLHFAAGHDYNLVMNGGSLDTGHSLQVDGSALGASDELDFHVRDATAGHIFITGGAADDNLSGGTGVTEYHGGLGADTLSGVNGRNIFDYSGVTQSTSTTHDLILSYDGEQGDAFHLSFVPTTYLGEIDGGTINEASFDADLATVANAAALPVGDAAVFSATSGSDSGNLYLVIDANGTAGYQAGQDYVIQLDLNSNTSTVTFI